MGAVLDELGHQVGQVRDDRAAHRRRFDVGVDPSVVLDSGQRGAQHVGHPSRPRPGPVGERAGQHQHALGVPAGPGGRVLEPRQLREHARAALRGLQLADLGDEPIHQAVVPPREVGREVAGPPVTVVFLRDERHRGGVQGRDRPRQRGHLTGPASDDRRDARQGVRRRARLEGGGHGGQRLGRGPVDVAAERPDRLQKARGHEGHRGDEHQHQQDGRHELPGLPCHVPDQRAEQHHRRDDGGHHARAELVADAPCRARCLRPGSLRPCCLRPCGPDGGGNSHRGPTCPRRSNSASSHATGEALSTAGKCSAAGGCSAAGDCWASDADTSRATGPRPAG